MLRNSLIVMMQCALQLNSIDMQIFEKQSIYCFLIASLELLARETERHTEM